MHSLATLYLLITERGPIPAGSLTLFTGNLGRKIYRYMYVIHINIINCTYYLFSHWLRVYS